MAAGKQTSTHTHVCNAVMLMWGSPRLAPKTSIDFDRFWLDVVPGHNALGTKTNHKTNKTSQQ